MFDWNSLILDSRFQTLDSIRPHSLIIPAACICYEALVVTAFFRFQPSGDVTAHKSVSHAKTSLRLIVFWAVSVFGPATSKHTALDDI